MAKSGDKSSSSGKKSLKRKAAAEELQEAAFAGDGETESGDQIPKAAAFPPGFSISEIKYKQRLLITSQCLMKPQLLPRFSSQHQIDLMGEQLRLCEQLSTAIPNSHVYYRRGLALKKIIPQCITRDFTDLIVINEDHKTPNGLILSHLPNGPTARFKMSSVCLCKEIKRRGKDPTEHIPEIILNNFTTWLGHSIGRMFASLFPHNPQFIGRQVATFHNQRDYIFFRFHRYIFRSKKKELGPHFTLKLRSLQKGTFDSKYGEYEWVHKPREMNTSRRKFHL
uniref:Ribosome production factor 1 n=1 Tax=Saimiri boliviensis boliviensis TaxID=39432 RepID=A0A2K6T1Z6_SAIBB